MMTLVAGVLLVVVIVLAAFIGVTQNAVAHWKERAEKAEQREFRFVTLADGYHRERDAAVKERDEYIKQVAQFSEQVRRMSLRS